MNEILNTLCNYPDSESDADVFIEPLDVLIDEDSADGNGLSNLNLSNLSGNQLGANASTSDKDKENVCDVESYEVDDDLPPSKKRKTKSC